MQALAQHRKQTKEQAGCKSYLCLLTYFCSAVTEFFADMQVFFYYILNFLATIIVVIE